MHEVEILGPFLKMRNDQSCMHVHVCECVCVCVFACIVVCVHITCKRASVPPHAGEDSSVVSEISSGSVCFGSAGCGTSSSANATTTETSDDESGPPRKKRKVCHSSASSVGRGDQGGGRRGRGGRRRSGRRGGSHRGGSGGSGQDGGGSQRGRGRRGSGRGRGRSSRHVSQFSGNTASASCSTMTSDEEPPQYVVS